MAGKSQSPKRSGTMASSEEVTADAGEGAAGDSSTEEAGSPPAAARTGRRESKIIIIDSEGDENGSENGAVGDGIIPAGEDGEEEEQEGSGSELESESSDHEGFKVLDAIVSHVKSSTLPPGHVPQPCKHYIDVEFTEPTQVNFASFK